MPSDQEQGTDFISIVVADSTRIHTQLLAATTMLIKSVPCS